MCVEGGLQAEGSATGEDDAESPELRLGGEANSATAFSNNVEAIIMSDNEKIAILSPRIDQNS